MSGKVFIDTDVLIYAATGREDFPGNSTVRTRSSRTRILDCRRR